MQEKIRKLIHRWMGRMVVVMSVFLTGLPTLCQDYHQGSLFPPNPIHSMYCKKYNIVPTKKKIKQNLSSYFHFFPPPMYSHLIWNVSTCPRPIAPLLSMAKDREPRSFLWLPSSNFRCFEQRSAPFHLAGQQIIIRGTKINICPQKEALSVKFSFKVPRIQFPVCWEKICNLASNSWTHLLILFSKHPKFKDTPLRDLLVHTGSSVKFFPWYQCSVRLSLLTLFHSIYPTAAANSPKQPKLNNLKGWPSWLREMKF